VFDDQLTLKARARRGRVKHWWGRRTRDGHTGAWCYLCDAPITTWSGRWPMTEQARIAIGLHRIDHIQGRLDTSSTKEQER
jgi:hypothetical protein